MWSARQTSLDRNVAVKVPRPELAGAGSVGESQFVSEVVVTGHLEHPNIVPIYELGRDSDGLPFYSMKHVQGKPWNELIFEKSEQENLEILMKVCDAVAFAHDRNFLHRDIKPHNVMVGEFGEVSLMDWGIAVAIERDPDKPWASLASGPAGTPAYMAPEMAAHNPSELGVISDVYLLGAVLYEIATGTPPHPKTGDTREALLAAAANEILPTDKTGELIDIARRAMATKLEDRYQSVTELQEAIREYRSHRESIKLSQSADEHYRDAVANHNSDKFARAKFAYEEALRLWDSNLAARHGLKVTVLAHAKNALEQENYELGISILNADEPSHRDLIRKLESKRASSRRLATFSKVAGGTAVAAVLLVVAITFYSYQQLKVSADQLEAEKETAVEQRKIAVKSANEAKLAEQVAREAEKKAKSAERTAVAAKDEARTSEFAAQIEKRRAEEAAYASEIGLAAESIRRNDFEKATRILERMDPSHRGYNSVMSKQRHLEWGLLRDAAKPATMTSLLDGTRVETIGSASDGSTVAAGTDDGLLFVWIRSEPAPIASVQPKTIRFGKHVSAIAVSRDGRYVAAGGTRTSNADPSASGKGDTTILIWDVHGEITDTPTTVLAGHSARVLSLQFSRDGRRIVSSASDRRAIVWDREQAKPVSVMRDHLERPVWDAKFSPDESQIVTACEDGRVRIWRIENGRQEASKIHDFRGHDGPVYSVAFTLDGDEVISGGYDRRLLRWSVGPRDSEVGDANLEQRLEGNNSRLVEVRQLGTDQLQHEASIRSLSVERVKGREYVLSGGNDNTIRVWSRGTATDRWGLDKVLRGHGRWVRSCVFSSDGRAVVSGAFDGVKVWNWSEYQLPRKLFPVAERRLGKRPSELGLSSALVSKYSQDGRWVATAYENGTVAVWEVASDDRTGGQLLGDGHALLTASGAFSDRGSKLLTAAGDNTTRLWDVERGVQLQTLVGTGYRGAATITWQESDRAVVVTGSDHRMTPAQLWILRKNQVVHSQGLLEDTAKEALRLRRGAKLASAPLSNESLDRVRRLKREIPDITTAQFSEDTTRFVLGDSSGKCFVFEIQPHQDRPRQLARFEAHGASVVGAVFLSGGSVVVTASEDGQVRYWNAESGTKIGEFPWRGPITSLGKSREGDKLVIGHAPVEGRELPIAEVYAIGDGGVERMAVLSPAMAKEFDSLARQPTVRSLDFVPESNQVLLSLYFPATDGASSDYQVARWDYEKKSSALRQVETAETGEISSATLKNNNELLVVGGKGARMWHGTAGRGFVKLVKSFRPPSSVKTLDFSYDPVSGKSDRLVFGDSEGNIHVYGLEGNRWNQQSGIAENLSGQHSHTLVTTLFDPRDPDRMLSADRSGTWILWGLDAKTKRWLMIQRTDGGAENHDCRIGLFSSDGRRLVLGFSSGLECFQRVENGQFDRGPWLGEVGPVQDAVFSRCGRWLVTSDGVRNVSFWDARGRRLATMNEDDAMAVTSMALSADRRRLITGQGKRIVVWDTSRLAGLEDAIGGRKANSHHVSELLSLEQHRAVTSVAISPDGKNVLSAGTEGHTLIWAGKPIAPITISTSASQIAYRVGEKAIPLDAGLIVSDPCRLADLDGVEVAVSLGRTIADERLTIQAHPSSGSRVTVREQDGETSVFFQAFPDDVPRRIGTFVDRVATSKLRIRLNEQADAESLQCLLRSFAYRVELADSISEVSLQGNSFADEGDVTQKVLVHIEGLRYRAIATDSDAANDESLYPKSLNVQIGIELERGEDESSTQEPTSSDNPTA